MAKPLQTVETLIRCHILQQLIWVCTVCELSFYGSPKYNGFWDRIHSVGFLPFLTREATVIIPWRFLRYGSSLCFGGVFCHYLFLISPSFGGLGRLCFVIVALPGWMSSHFCGLLSYTTIPF